MTQLDQYDCEAVVRRLWPYVDGMLAETERGRVTRHLEQCTDCRSHFDFARAFLDAVASAEPDAATNAALRERVMAALVAEGFTG